MLEPSVNTLRIKRKRDEQGPHALVIDQRSAKKQQQTYHGAIFRRIDPNDASSGQMHTPQRTANAQVGSTIPPIRVTKPGEEERLDRAHAKSANRTQSTPDIATNLDRARQSPPSTRPKADLSTLRRFHLSRRPLTASQIHSGVVGKRRKRDNAVPVFVERRSLAHTDTIIPADKAQLQEGQDASGDPAPTDVASSPRKRPGASAVERQWRANNWSALENKKPPGTDQPPQELVSDLEKFAKEIDHEESKAISKSPPLRRGPKAPALRYKHRHPEEFSSVDPEAMDIDVDDDGDYVYDTYVRDITMTEPLVDQGLFGLVVIADEDQELWETFEDGDESDDHFDTDDEDENAEDYYGADYPEDEIDSDDEIGVNSYQYRQGASDDEEYDAENGAWSDEEETDSKKPWKSKLQVK